MARAGSSSSSSSTHDGAPGRGDEAAIAQDRGAHGARGARGESSAPDEPGAVLTFGRLTLRGETDDLRQDWWFASTAIPLAAATIGPLANVLSIAALVSKWRVALPNDGQLPEGTDDAGTDIADPEW